MVAEPVIECPLVDVGNSTDSVTVHNITRSASCKTGGGLLGCCVERMYCEFNTSNIDLTLYGPPGFRTSCSWKEVCCPARYLQPIPLFNSTQTIDDNDINMDDAFFNEKF
ncbi:uncharacterized protein LOC113492365 isoform X2 [Trichoplusia ni]|nr:uncharacterized protein LOC113492365 isoform X2 [Trichoplusia ni]